MSFICLLYMILSTGLHIMLLFALVNCKLIIIVTIMSSVMIYVRSLQNRMLIDLQRINYCVYPMAYVSNDCTWLFYWYVMFITYTYVIITSYVRSPYHTCNTQLLSHYATILFLRTLPMGLRAGTDAMMKGFGWLQHLDCCLFVERQMKSIPKRKCVDVIW